MKDKQQNILAVLLLGIFGIILYFNSLQNTFTFDDLHSISDNLYIKDLRNIPLLFKGYYTSNPYIPKGMFRPFLLLTFAFNYFFDGLRPLGYHIINILIHCLNGILLYSLLRFLKVDLKFGWALFISLLFMAHPLNTETVTYISCRSDLLVAFFIMLAFYSFVREKILLSVVLYILALLTKETAIVFGPLIFSYWFFYLKGKQIKKDAGKIIVFIFILILISILYWAYRGLIFKLNLNDLIFSSSKSAIRGFWSNIYLQLTVSIFYLRLFFWPHPLNLHHEFPDYKSLFETPVFFSAGIMIIILILILTLRKNWPLICLGLSWYIICLIPKFYAVLHFPAMEHHFYLPGIGIYLALAAGMESIYLKYQRKFILTACGIIGLFTILVWSRNYEWKDAFTLYKSAVKNNPLSAVAHNNLGIAYLDINLFDAAEREFKKTLSLSNSVDAQINSLINLANIYSRQNKFEEAKQRLDEALKIKPNFAAIYQTYGFIYKQQGEVEKAEKIWTKGLSFNTKTTGILDNLGLLYLEENKLLEAKICFQKAIQVNPDSYLAYFGLGQILEQESNIDQAISRYKKSVELNPSGSILHYAIGRLYARRSNPKALYYLKEAIKLNPAIAEAQNDLAVLYASMDPPKLDLAREHARKALSLGYPVEKEFLKLIGIEGEGREVKN